MLRNLNINVLRDLLEYVFIYFRKEERCYLQPGMCPEPEWNLPTFCTQDDVPSNLVTLARATHIFIGIFFPLVLCKFYNTLCRMYMHLLFFSYLYCKEYISIFTIYFKFYALHWYAIFFSVYWIYYAINLQFLPLGIYFQMILPLLRSNKYFLRPVPLVLYLYLIIHSTKN